MDRTKTYYQNSDWQERVHILPDGDQWRNWQHQFREDLIITPDGIFIVRKEDDFTYRRPATARDAAQFFAPAPPGHKRQGAIQMNEKIPFVVLPVSVAFFRAVWKAHRREDVLLLYRHDTTYKCTLVHPKLLAAGSGYVDYDVPNTPPGYTRFGSLHSHGHEAAYHSSADLSDDLESPGLHVIIGSLNREFPSLHCVFSHNGTCFDISPSDVFISSDAHQQAKVSFPSKWMEQNVPAGPRPHRACAAAQPSTTSLPPHQPLYTGDTAHVQGTNECTVVDCPFSQTKIPAAASPDGGAWWD